jgi:serine/threonine-protein kinase HipA
MGRRVRDVHSERKYQGSYEAIARLMQFLSLSRSSVERFFEQVAFSIMVRNGDAHLKNFGILYDEGPDAKLAPMFDVVTTAIYKYSRVNGGPPMEDFTMALKLFTGRHASKTYPETHELLAFARKVCGVSRPQEVIERIADAMRSTLHAARSDGRIPGELLGQMSEMWKSGLAYATETRRGRRP